jgi:ubiquinone/menaquinone biosynthesis C-methylase UbiE
MGQRVFRSRMVPPIYERFWRPSAARSAFGRRGPNAEEEGHTTLAMLDISPGSRVLDVGCGPGNYTRQFAGAAGEGLTIGLGASAAMLAAAVKRSANPNVAYARGDGAELPFEANIFDAVGCVGVLHLISEPMRALDEMVRVLTPGGRLALVATCALMQTRSWRRAGIHAFKRDELTGVLNERGLTEIEQRVMGRGQFVAAARRL